MSPFVRIFLGLVAVNAAIGSAVLLAGGMDGTGGKIFLTSLLATIGSLVGSVCAIGWRSPARRPFAVLGVAATLVAFGLLEVVIWASVDSEWVGKLVGSAAIVATASAGTALLGQARLAPHHRWIVTAADVLTAIVVGMAIVGLWAEVDSDAFLRVLGVLCVGLATAAIVVPVLHRVDRADRGSPTPDTAGFCPNCGAASVTPPGRIARCPACSRRYEVRFTDDRGTPEMVGTSGSDAQPVAPPQN